MAYKTYEVRVYDTGAKFWYQNGKQHREDGPAVECANGSKYWYLNGKQHHEDGPAVEWADGSKEWYQNGSLHRDDGPAVECANGDKYWHLNGEFLSEEQHRERTNPVKELTVAQVAELLGYKVKIVE